jgi:pilus assembly protein Flp/PilA
MKQQPVRANGPSCQWVVPVLLSYGIQRHLLESPFTKNYGGEMTQLIRKMWSDDEGQDLIEYALMLTLILLVSVAAIQGIGTKVSQIFTNVNTSLSST